MNKLLICNCEDSTGNTTVRCCNLCGLSVDHVWKPQLTFEKFTLLKETPTIATDNTLPPSSPTATAEEVNPERILFTKIIEASQDGEFASIEDEILRVQNDPAHQIVLEAMREYAQKYASLKEQEAHNRAVQECIDFIKDWYENERALEGKDFYEELEKLKK